MRKITKIAAKARKPKPRTAADMGADDVFKIEGYPDWWRLVHDGGGRLVSMDDMSLRHRMDDDLHRDVVTEFLADGESLNIGPEVKDGSATDA